MPHVDQLLGVATFALAGSFVSTAVDPVARSARGARALAEALAALRGLARGVEAWLEARRRVAADRDALAAMSERELLDIGLDRASANAVVRDR